MYAYVIELTKMTPVIFRVFVHFELSNTSGVWEALRFVIVALPGLFSYLFLTNNRCHGLLTFTIILCVFNIFSMQITRWRSPGLVLVDSTLEFFHINVIRIRDASQNLWKYQQLEAHWPQYATWINDYRTIIAQVSILDFQLPWKKSRYGWWLLNKHFKTFLSKYLQWRFCLVYFGVLRITDTF